MTEPAPKKKRNFWMTTLTGGVVFLVPFVLIIWVLAQAYFVIRTVIEPISQVIPFENTGTFILLNLMALGLIVLICFLAGLAARSKRARRFVEWLENRFLSKMPLYHFIKGATASTLGAEPGAQLRPVMARFDDYWQVAFEIERLDDGKVAVYLPGAPEPWSGTICILSEDRVGPLDREMIDVIEHFQQLGRGSKTFLERHFTPKTAAPEKPAEAQ